MQTTDKLNDAWDDLESAIDDWVSEYPELIRHPESFARRAADCIFEEVLGLERDAVDGWTFNDD